MAPEQDLRCGFIALAGRPNVGKSTLLNALLEQKLSIVSDKPQTTRQRVLGIRTTPKAQMLFLDTPGLHGRERRTLNRYMNRAARAAILDADIVLFLVEAGRWTEDDELALQQAAQSGAPVGLIVTKVDKIKPRSKLLPFLQEAAARHPFRFVVPLSATAGENLESLVQELEANLPEGGPLYPPDQVTDMSTQAWIGEVVREKLIQRMEKELPYAIAVEVEQFEREGNLLRAGATIWVEREGQKAIVIGKGGQILKEVGQAARYEIEHELDCKVFLQLWVKVRDDWSDSDRLLRTLGYEQ